MRGIRSRRRAQKAIWVIVAIMVIISFVVSMVVIPLWAG